MGEDQGRLFNDDMLPPAKKRRGVDTSRAEHQHVVPRDQQPAHFSGATFEAKHDEVRLMGKLEKLRDLTSDGKWRTLEHLSQTLQSLHEGERFPEASVSAALRALRHPANGKHKVDRKHIGDRRHGLYAYRVRTASDQTPEDRGGAKR